jgi:hypothetical protein
LPGICASVCDVFCCRSRGLVWCSWFPLRQLADAVACCVVDGGGSEQHARLGDVEIAQDVLDLACPRLQDARQRIGLKMGLSSVVVGWLARGHRRAG